MRDSVSVGNDVTGRMEESGFADDPDEWRLFIVASNPCLEAVFYVMVI